MSVVLAGMLSGSQKKATLLPVVVAVAANLTGVINTVGAIQFPSRVGRNQFIEVAHLPTSIDECMITAVADSGLSDNYSSTVEGERPTLSSGQSAQILHLAIRPQESMRVLSCGRFPGDLVVTVDRPGSTVQPTQSAQIL